MGPFGRPRAVQVVGRSGEYGSAAVGGDRKRFGALIRQSATGTGGTIELGGLFGDEVAQVQMTSRRPRKFRREDRVADVDAAAGEAIGEGGDAVGVLADQRNRRRARAVVGDVDLVAADLQWRGLEEVERVPAERDLATAFP